MSNSNLDENINASKSQIPVAKFLFNQFIASFNAQVDIMFDYIDVSFRLFGSSRDTTLVRLLDELDILRVFLAKNGTLSSKHADIIIGHLRHCLVQDSVAQHILLEKVDGVNWLATDVKTS